MSKLPSNNLFTFVSESPVVLVNKLNSVLFGEAAFYVIVQAFCFLQAIRNIEIERTRIVRRTL